MAEYIEREALLNKLKERDLCLCVTEWDIKDAPAADVAPVRHGRWENITGGMIPLGDCSECKARQPVIGTNYCKNCGAKMDLEDGNA